MNPTTTPMTIPTGRIACLHAARGTTVHVRHGSLWITQDGCTQDTFISAGESFTIERNGTTILSACAPWHCAELAIEGRSTARIRLAQRLVGIARMLFVPPTVAVR